MERTDFYPFMKISLKGEYGVVIDQFSNAENAYYELGASDKSIASALYGIIRWDTGRKSTSEIGGGYGVLLLHLEDTR